MSDYRNSHQGAGKGTSYHASFTSNRYRSYIWQREQVILNKILRLQCQGDVDHLDFACGTGRILSFLEPRVCASVGIDISQEMLIVARRASPRSEIIQADLTRGTPLGNRKFQLITAFRFFPNAEPSLREEALGAITRHLSRDGLLVLNNHKHSGSLLRKSVRLIGREPGGGMSYQECIDLVSKHGLEISAIHPVCIVPSSEQTVLFPIPVLNVLDNLSCATPNSWRVAENIILQCRWRDS